MNANVATLIKPLSVFCKVAECLSISRAAELLGVSQPAVSSHIAHLEQTFDCLLFERRRPQLRLTPDGESLLLLARPIVEGFEQLPEKFWLHKGEANQGTVRIAAGETILLQFMPRIAKRFAEQFPRVQLRFSTVSAKDIPSLLKNDEVDFALGTLIGEHEHLRQTPFYRFSPMLLLPCEHPLAEKNVIYLQDIAQCSLIVPPEISYTWQTLKRVFAERQLPFRVAIEASGSEVAKRFVSAGLGVAILSEACVRGEHHLLLRAIEDFSPERMYSVIERRGRLLSPQAEQFKTQVLAWAKEME